MAADDAYMIFHGLKVRVKVVEPEREIARRVFIMSSPITSAFNWRKITPELSQLNCLTVMMDMPGFGLSACGEGVPQDNRVRSNIGWGVIDEIDAALGDDMGSWHLVGHGTACQAIVDMANTHPDSVTSQVFVSPFLDSEGGVPIGRARPDRWFDDNILDPAGYRRFMDRMFGRRMDEYITDTMRRMFLREGARASFRMMLAHKGKCAPVRGFAPVMAIWGERDEMMDARARDALRNLAPEAETHLLKTAGHIPMETHSHALRDYLRGWLKYTQ